MDPQKKAIRRSMATTSCGSETTVADYSCFVETHERMFWTSSISAAQAATSARPAGVSRSGPRMRTTLGSPRRLRLMSVMVSKSPFPVTTAWRRRPPPGCRMGVDAIGVVV